MSDLKRSTMSSPASPKGGRTRSRVRYSVETCRLVLGMLLTHVSSLATFLRRRAPSIGALVANLAVRLSRRPLALFTVALVPALVFSTIDDWSLAGAVKGEGRPTTSRYVHWLTDDVAADRAFSYRLGCRGGERDESGVVVLAFGRQVTAGGTRGFRGPEVLRSYAQIAEVVASYRDGLIECGAGPIVLAVTTSNYELHNVEEAAVFGAAWLAMVSSIADRGRVRIEGGTDLEPGWGGLAAARAWVQAYKATGRVLYSNASADGCPLAGSGGGCANGWDTASLAELVWGGGGVAVPQIYRRDGAQARQWKVLAEHWLRTGDTPLFAGVMTQHRACKQVQNANCPQLSQPHDVAKKQLGRLLGDGIDLPVGTDVGWG